MAARFAESSVTVASGLAAGIDTAVHRAALEAGGRTIAVIGTGVTKTYPKDNTALAEAIVARGAVVSQFWPSTPPATYTFPRRNAVMSGIAQGTVVIEASVTSGARMQARLALAQGKRVWLIRSLVASEVWAQTYVSERGARQVVDVDEVMRDLASPERVADAGRASRQLTLELL
jgi:DNA processing protein